ncbi:MAG: hypothetical protein AB7S75_16175 [Desulfococcaceae bacterium]
MKSLLFQFWFFRHISFDRQLKAFQNLIMRSCYDFWKTKIGSVLLKIWHEHCNPHNTHFFMLYDKKPHNNWLCDMCDKNKSESGEQRASISWQIDTTRYSGMQITQYNIQLGVVHKPFQGVKNNLLTSGCYRQPFLMLSAGGCYGLLQKPPDIKELR